MPTSKPAEVKVKLPHNADFCVDLCQSNNQIFEGLPEISLDHGLSVPFWYLQQAGWSGNSAFLTLPAVVSPDRLAVAGEALRGYLKRDPQNVAVIFSIELSHCLNDRSPVAPSPAGQKFDTAVCDAISGLDLSRFTAIDADTAAAAEQDALDALIFGEHLLTGFELNAKILSYQDELGMGFLVSLLYDNQA